MGCLEAALPVCFIMWQRKRGEILALTEYYRILSEILAFTEYIEYNIKGSYDNHVPTMLNFEPLYE